MHVHGVSRSLLGLALAAALLGCSAALFLDNITVPSELFPTPTHARDYIRKTRPAGSTERIHVTLNPGTFPPLELDFRDDFTSWQAGSDLSRPVISAGRRIPAAAFRPWDQRPSVLVANRAGLCPLGFGQHARRWCVDSRL